MNARQVSYRLIVCAIILYSATVTASQYADYSRRPLSEMLEVYSKFEASFQAGSNYNVGAAAALMANIGQKGGREVLPFLKEKSFDPETHELIRSAAAETYVDIADVEDSVLFLAKYCDDPTVKQGKWLLIQQYLDKLTPEVKNRLSSDALSRVHTVLLTIMQKTDVRDAANRINLYMLQAVPQYTNSVQRACLTRFATEGNEWVTNTFHPIKAHFDKIPPRQRIDLRKRFPDLPPLPDDAPARSPVKVALAIIVGGVALAVCAVAVWLAARRRKVRKAA
ncbi:MAG: hypothetical protein PHS50_15245 [Kiritimatiellae bacterium]|nr:hypothetical protein [Kiritimatiellia bacterium]